ncbi:MAG: hypothetical protein N2561_05560 [Bacteroidetes bacterium]|nr:hypothetical protein [Rhodothermia bacterium]MCS7154853.1 hypothetical protein [Bacteroidota bacterium]MCX7906989.1 hypothetical protein [Bacteroidota bacterium]MDW8137647.1 hypothetical protein [Bacteroidota bacterium]MDW8285399.1 hypothetical protein [Bacteroidota bacterium]
MRRWVPVLVSSVLAVLLWLGIRLNRDYTVEFSVPLELEYSGSGWAPAEPPPDRVRVVFRGEGWHLLRLYLKRPRLRLEVQPGRIRLDQLASQGWHPPLPPTVTAVRFGPRELEFPLEPVLRQRLPLEVEVYAQTDPRMGLLEPPRLEPESVLVTGPASLVRALRSWRLPPVRLEGLTRSVERWLTTTDPERPHVRVMPERVLLRVRVAEFTEATRRVSIELRNRPESAPLYRLIPEQLWVTFRVPLEEFEIADTTRALVAYVDYEELRRNTTGVLVPTLELPPFLHLKVVRIEPPSVRFLRVVVDTLREQYP